MTIIWQSLFDWWIPLTLIALFLRYKDAFIYYSTFYICLYHMRFSHQIVQEFEDSAHWAMLALKDFRRSDFALAFFALWISGVQTSPLLSSDFAFSFVFIKSCVQTSPSYGLDVQTSFASLFLASQFRCSNFIFCR